MEDKFSVGQRVSLYGSCPNGTIEGRSKGTVRQVFSSDEWAWAKYEILWDNGMTSIVGTSQLDPL